MNRLRQLHALGVETVWTLRPPLGEGTGGADGGRSGVVIESGSARLAPEGAGAAADRVDGAAGSPPGIIAGPMQPGATWALLEQSVAACSACPLCRSRNRPVVGSGNRAGPLMIVSDAPDADEDAEGLPFAAQSGRLLDNMLAAIGLSRDGGVYLTNIVKCRPPAHGSPQQDEIRQCAGWLQAQVERVAPRLILALGRSAAQGLLSVETPLPELRGQLHVQFGRPVLVSYHPTHLLRTPRDKAKAWEDLLRVRRELLKSPAERR